MRRNNLKYLRNNFIESKTEKRIREYESLIDSKIQFPVPIEGIIERVLGLSIHWDVIAENSREEIFGGLIPSQRKIVMNEKHLDLFNEKPGLERSTLGHEAGHWDLDIDQSSIHHPSLLNLQDEASCVHRKSEKSQALVKILRHALGNNEAYKVYKELKRGKDAPEVKSAVDRYQSSLLMPKWLLLEAASRYDFTKWKDLYELKDEIGVTISNLRVRLERLDMIYIPDNSKEIFRSRDHYAGQTELF